MFSSVDSLALIAIILENSPRAPCGIILLAAVCDDQFFSFYRVDASARKVIIEVVRTMI